MIRSVLAGALLLMAGSAEPTAVVLGIDHGRDAVRLEGPGLSLDPRPVPLQTVAPGVVVHVPAGASIVLACSTPSLVRIEGPTSWRLDSASCRKGRPIDRADYDLVAPRGGRFRYAGLLPAFERELRGDDDSDPLIPVVLSPRETAIRSPRPILLWRRVPLAAQYRIKWSSRGADAFSIQVGAEEVDCSVRADGLDVCTLPWPSDKPDLPPGRTFFLSLAARRDFTDDWHAAEGSVEVRTLTADEAALVETKLAGLERLGFEGAPREAALAGVLAESGLRAEAIESLRKAVELAPAAALRITLADLYLSTGLGRLARALYSQTLEDPDPAVRADAASGMGQVEYAQGRFHEAALRFRQAAELYGRRSAQSRSDALEAVRKAEARLRTKP